MAAPRGWGAPTGNQNALKHGLYTREAIARRRAFNQILREMRGEVRDSEEKT